MQTTQMNTTQPNQDPWSVLENLKEGEVSPYMVMRSQAGHYVGTYIKRDEMAVPHSRVSDYMKEGDANEWLRNGLETKTL